MQLTIEKNVPMIGTKTGKYSAAQDAIKKMDIGDSFLFPCNSVPAPLYKLAKEVGAKVSARKVAEGQYRVWRAA